MKDVEWPTNQRRTLKKDREAVKGKQSAKLGEKHRCSDGWDFTACAAHCVDVMLSCYVRNTLKWSRGWNNFKWYCVSTSGMGTRHRLKRKHRSEESICSVRTEKLFVRLWFQRHAGAFIQPVVKQH